MSAHELTAAPPTAFESRVGAHHRALPPIVLAGTFMVVLDFFIVNVVLPSMQSDLHAGSGAVAWVVAGYRLTCAAGLITAGRLGDQFGRRRMFALGRGLRAAVRLVFTILAASYLVASTRAPVLTERYGRRSHVDLPAGRQCPGPALSGVNFRCARRRLRPRVRARCRTARALGAVVAAVSRVLPR